MQAVPPHLVCVVLGLKSGASCKPATFLTGLYCQPWDAHWVVDLQVVKCDVLWPWPEKTNPELQEDLSMGLWNVLLIAGRTEDVVSTGTPLSSSPKEGVLDYAKTESPAIFPGSSILCKAQARPQTLHPCTFYFANILQTTEL